MLIFVFGLHAFTFSYSSFSFSLVFFFQGFFVLDCNVELKRRLNEEQNDQ